MQKSTAICIKTPRNMLQIITRFESKSLAIRLKLHRKIISKIQLIENKEVTLSV